MPRIRVIPLYSAVGVEVFGLTDVSDLYIVRVISLQVWNYRLV